MWRLVENMAVKNDIVNRSFTSSCVEVFSFFFFKRSRIRRHRGYMTRTTLESGSPLSRNRLMLVKKKDPERVNI